MIAIHNLSTGYNNRTVGRHLSASLQQGELVSLLGANGIGKSTLLRTLAAFQPPLEGDILIDGVPLSRLSARQRSRLIGVVLTERTSLQNMRVNELVGMGRSPYTGFWGGLSKDDECIVEEAMRRTGIEKLRDRFVSTLSDGERQKVMIAKAVAQETPIILLDEPTAFLDFPSKVDTMRMLQQLARSLQKIIFLSTHDIEMALQLSDRIWLMTAEGLITGTPNELAKEGTLQRFLQHEGVSFNPDTFTLEIQRGIN